MISILIRGCTRRLGVSLARCAALAAAIAGGFAMPAAIAAEAGASAEASAWSEGLRSAVRILSGGREEADGTYKAGLEIRLAPGFKTYWRTPGDSGVPPVFDWSKSENVAGVEVLWPAPVRFPDGAGSSIGYKSDVILPLVVTPRHAGQPVRLAIDLRYAVCQDICIPAEAELSLPLAQTGAGAGAGAAGAALAAARSRVPVLSARDAAGGPVALTSVVARRGGDGSELVVALRLREGAALTDVFAEAAEPWLFGTPSLERQSDADVIARFPIDDSPKGETMANVPLTLTVATAQGTVQGTVQDTVLGAVEISTELDARPLTR